MEDGRISFEGDAEAICRQICSGRTFKAAI